MPQRPNFCTIFGPKGSQNSGLWSLSQKVFTGFTSVLLHMLIASTFRARCVECEAQRPKFLGHLGPRNDQNSVLFLLFCQKVCSGFKPVLLYMFIGATLRDVYNMGPKCPILGPF